LRCVPRLIVSWLSVLAYVVSQKDQGLSEKAIKNELNETLFFIWGQLEFEVSPFDDGESNFSWMVEVRGYEFANAVFEIASSVLKKATEEERAMCTDQALLAELNCFLLSQGQAPLLFAEAPEQFGFIWAQLLQEEFNYPSLSLHVAHAS
jgi:hypothetical protein